MVQSCKAKKTSVGIHGQCEERIKCKGNVSGAKKKRVILHDRNDGRVVVNT